VTTAAIRPQQSLDYGRPLLCVALAFGVMSGTLELGSVSAALMPLAVLTAQWTSVWLDWLGLPVVRSTIELRHASGLVCELGPSCTALPPLALLATAIATSTLPGRRKVLGLLGGTVLMILLNQIRLISLFWYGLHSPEWLDPLHDWAWPALLVGSGVLYWRRLHGGSARERTA
jgi:exosortase/archaeosortase family protein